MLRNSIRFLLLISVITVVYANNNLNSSNWSIPKNFYAKVLAGESWEIHNTVKAPGTLFVTNSMNSVVITGGVGYQFFSFLRAELEYSYRPDYQLKTHSDIGNITDSNVGFSDIKVQTGMANLYLDYLFNCWTPYLMGGIGYGVTNYEVTSIYNVALIDTPVGTIRSNINHNFVKQIGAGFLFYLNKNLRWDANYRFVNMGEVESGKGLNVVGNTPAWPNSFIAPDSFNKFRLRSNEVQLGVYYFF